MRQSPFDGIDVAFRSAPTFEEGQSSCTPADPGYFVNEEGATQQELCPPGEYASGSGNSECSPCERGKFSDEEGLGDCKFDPYR